MKSLNDIFKELYADSIKDFIPSGVTLSSLFGKANRTVEDWIKSDITEEDVEKYPNAKAAYNIKNSKLFKALG